MDPKGKGMVVNDNEKESIFNELRDDKANDSGSSQKKKDGKKRRIKRIVYYDSDESSSSQRDAALGYLGFTYTWLQQSYRKYMKSKERRWL
jgi:hypothetical protein